MMTGKLHNGWLGSASRRFGLLALLALSGCMAHFRYPSEKFTPPKDVVHKGAVAICCEGGCQACQSVEEVSRVSLIANSMRKNFGEVALNPTSGHHDLSLWIKRNPSSFWDDSGDESSLKHLLKTLTIPIVPIIGATTGIPLIRSNPRIELRCFSSTHPEGIDIKIESTHLAWWGGPLPLILLRPFYLGRCVETPDGMHGDCGMQIERTYERLFAAITKECL